MARISKHRVKTKDWNLMFNLITTAITNTKSKSQSQMFMRGLMSRPERTMLAKRFATCVLINANTPPSVISKTIKVSRPTISKLARYLEQDTQFQAYLSKHFNIKTNKTKNPLNQLEKILGYMYQHKKNRYGQLK